MCELHGASPNRTRPALHQDRTSFDRSRDVNSPMSGYAGNAETSTLLHGHVFGQWDYLPQRNHRVLGRGPKRTVRLSSKTPHTPPHPFLRYPFAHGINRPCAIAVRDDARIGHSDSKRIFTFFYVARIYA